MLTPVSGTSYASIFSIPAARCRFGTFKPSRRQRRSIRLWFTCQPSYRSSMVIDLMIVDHAIATRDQA